METNNNSSFVSFIVLFCFILAGLFFAQFVGLLAALPFNGFDLGILDIISGGFTNYPEHRNAVLAFQAGNSIGLFILTPLAYLYFYEKKDSAKLFLESPLFSISLALLVVVIMFSFFPVSGLLVTLNQKMELPAAFSGIESKMMEMEESMKVLTAYMVDFDSVGQFLFGLFVIAVIPALGEELLFRGILQKKIASAFKNPHIGIWLAAFIFSAFHMQFYGLLPRMVLGALFGYLYYYSKNLAYPIIGHFINNGATLTAMYLLAQSGEMEVDMDKATDFPVGAAVISLVIVIFLLAYFKRLNQVNNGRKLEEGI